MSSISAFADKNTAELLFTEAAIQYQEDNLVDAVGTLELALMEDPANKNIKVFLVKLLIELAIEENYEGKNSEALIHIEMAKKLDPYNENVKTMYGFIQEPSKSELSEETGTKDESTIDLMILLEIFQKEQSEKMDGFLKSQKSLRDIIKKSEQKRLETLKTLIDGQKVFGRTAVMGIKAVIIAIMVVFVFIYFILKHASVKKDAVLFQYQQRLMTIMREKNLISSDKSVPLLGPPKRIMESLEPDKRIRGIEIIEAELVEEAEVDKEIAVGLLEPFLDDDDIQIKARAIEALYKYKSQLAMNTLKEMSKEDNLQTRSSVCQILSNFCTPEATSILLKMLMDSETEVKREAAKGLQKIIEIAQSSENKLPQDLISSIKSSLKTLALEEGWVI